MSYYAEQKTANGSWMPVRFSEEQKVDKRGRLDRNDATGPVLRKIEGKYFIPINEGHKHLNLDQLFAVYSPDGPLRGSLPKPLPESDYIHPDTGEWLEEARP